MSDESELQELISALADLRDTALEVTPDMIPDVASNYMMVVHYAKQQLLDFKRMKAAKEKTAPQNWCDHCSTYVDMQIVEQGEGVWKDYICTCPHCGTTTVI